LIKKSGVSEETPITGRKNYALCLTARVEEGAAARAGDFHFE